MTFTQEDRNAIIDLLHRYTYAVDDGDFREVGQLFEHATFYGAGDSRPLNAREVVEKFETNLILYDGSPRTQHRLSNVTIGATRSPPRSGSTFRARRRAASRRRRRGPLLQPQARNRRLKARWLDPDTIVGAATINSY